MTVKKSTSKAILNDSKKSTSKAILNDSKKVLVKKY